MGGDSGSDGGGNDSYVTARGDEEGGFTGTIDGNISLGQNNANAATYNNAMSQFNDDGTLTRSASGNMRSDQDNETIANYNQALDDRDNSRLGGDEFTAVSLFGNQQVSTEEGPDNFVSDNNPTARGGLTDFNNNASLGIGPLSLGGAILGIASGGLIPTATKVGLSLADKALDLPNAVEVGVNKNGVQVNSPLVTTITETLEIEGKEMRSPAMLNLDENPGGYVDDALNMGKQIVNDVTGLFTGDITIDDTPLPESLNDSSNDYVLPTRRSVVPQSIISQSGAPSTVEVDEEEELVAQNRRLNRSSSSLFSSGFTGFS